MHPNRKDQINQITASLVRYAAEIKAPEDALADPAYDAQGDENLDDLNTIEDEDAQDEFISTCERLGANLVNEGLAVQIAYLLQGFGDLVQGEEDIRRWLRESVASHAG